ncbi:MAG: hypothetical protein ACI4TF_00365 [Oliverpabstia sp.]
MFKRNYGITPRQIR